MNRKSYYVIARDFNHDGVIKGKMIFTDINNKFIKFFSKQEAEQYLKDNISKEEIIQNNWKVVIKNNI